MQLQFKTVPSETNWENRRSNSNNSSSSRRTSRRPASQQPASTTGTAALLAIRCPHKDLGRLPNEHHWTSKICFRLLPLELPLPTRSCLSDTSKWQKSQSQLLVHRPAQRSNMHGLHDAFFPMFKCSTDPKDNGACHERALDRRIASLRIMHRGPLMSGICTMLPSQHVCGRVWSSSLSGFTARWVGPTNTSTSSSSSRRPSSSLSESSCKFDRARSLTVGASEYHLLLFIVFHAASSGDC